MNMIVLRPDRRYLTKLLVGIALLAVICLGSIGALGYFIGLEEGGRAGARLGVLVPTILNLLWIVPAMLLLPPYYRSLSYEIGADEVVMRVGVITKSIKHVPFRTITNLKVNRDPFDRLLGLGTLEVQTAGMGGQSGAEESLVGLAAVQEVYEQVAAAVRSFRAAMGPTAAAEEPGPELPAPVQRAILEELRLIRAALEAS